MICFHQKGLFWQGIAFQQDNLLHDSSKIIMGKGECTDNWNFHCCFYYSIEEAKEWTMRLKPSGGCNLLKAMKHIYKLKDIDSIVLVLGSV